MKNLINALQKGNLKPRERALLLVHNAVKLETTGKEILTEADKQAVKSWTPIDNAEAKEYNRFISAWEIAGMAELDAQTTFLNAKVAYWRARNWLTRLIDTPSVKAVKEAIERFKHVIPTTLEEANRIAKLQREAKIKAGWDYGHTIYRVTMDELDKDLKADILMLYVEAETETSFLDDEEYLANLYGDKGELTEADKQDLAQKIARAGYNKYANEYQTWHYFASIPTEELYLKWADKRKLRDAILEQTREGDEPDVGHEAFTKTITKYAKDHNTTPEDELTAVALEWVNNGVLDEYLPMFKDTSREAYEGQTKRPINEIYTAWIEAKAKTRAKIDQLVGEGQLEREGDTIAGESLYNYQGDIKYLSTFKERADRYEPSGGYVFDPKNANKCLDGEFLIGDLDDEGNLTWFSGAYEIKQMEDFIDSVIRISEIVEGNKRELTIDKDVMSDLVEASKQLTLHYAILLSFKEIFDRLSVTYGIDLTYKVKDWIETTEQFIEHHNQFFKIMADAVTPHQRMITPQLATEIKDDPTIKISETKPDYGRTKGYVERFENTLGKDF